MIAVDVFAGAGGLTTGLKRAGMTVGVAIELDAAAVHVYSCNHPEVHVFRQDVRTIRGADIRRAIDGQRVDVLAACPPCQGFSSLTAKYKDPDARNELVGEVGRLVEELEPRFVMLENVPRLATRGSDLFGALCKSLTESGYHVSWKVLQVADYGVPQSRRRLVLFASREFVPFLPVGPYARRETSDRRAWRTVRDALGGLQDAITLAEATRLGGPQRHAWHVVRNLSPQNQTRLEAAAPGAPCAAMDRTLRPKSHQRDDIGYFSNVYGRMKWDEPSPTITAGCTTPSMGRFGHPSQNRTISVHEAALLQTFPPGYVFDSPHMGVVTRLIGNALPCDFAEALARSCVDQIARHDERYSPA